MLDSIPFPAFLPDQSPLSGGLLRAENVYAAADGYRPLPAPESVSESLDEDFLGGGSFIATDGTAYLLTGTATDLYRLVAGEWDSLIGSLSAGRWHFAQFGDFVVAVNGDDTLEVDLDAGTASALSGAPKGAGIAVVGDYVVIIQADGDILKVQWSAFNDHTEWTPGTDQSGFQPMLTGGEIMGIGGGEYGVILQRQRIVRMERTGDGTDPFSFVEITPNVGCASKGSVAQAGRSIFFLSDRGFMALEDGSLPRPIGNEKVDRWWRANVSREDFERIHSAVDPENTLVFWLIPGSLSVGIVYNWVLDRWSTFRLGAQGVFAGFSNSITLEEYSALYGNLDTAPYSLDHPRFSGGAPRLYVVDTNRELGTFNGDPLGATIETGWFELADGQRARLQHIEPMGDMTTGVTLTVRAKARLGDVGTETIATTIRTSGIMPVRCSGQFVSLQWAIAPATAWSYFQGQRIAFEAGGER